MLALLVFSCSISECSPTVHVSLSNGFFFIEFDPIRSSSVCQQDILSTPFPWAPLCADLEPIAELQRSYSGCMTPIWQAECPEAANETSSALWEAAFRSWRTDLKHHGPLPDLAALLGLPRSLVPSPRPLVRAKFCGKISCCLYTLGQVEVQQLTATSQSGALLLHSCRMQDVRRCNV